MDKIPFPVPDLTGKTALITGASGGIAASVTRMLVARGAGDGAAAAARRPGVAGVP
jgi:NAD(P)-dependent dehydrogenase (short-subunit alcohol dehydrogenase family)